MTDTERDKINQTIHEARGLCWHEDDPKYSGECLKCGEDILDEWNFAIVPNPDYTSDWLAWGAALEWAQGEEWWGEFISNLVQFIIKDCNDVYSALVQFIIKDCNREERVVLHDVYSAAYTVADIISNPERGSLALFQFLKGHWLLS